MTWRPMTEYVFPWPHKNLIVAVFIKDDEDAGSDLLRVHVGEHGAMFYGKGTMTTIHEDGWIPFAWKVDDTPDRDDSKWPPLWTDYLTEPEA